MLGLISELDSFISDTWKAMEGIGIVGDVDSAVSLLTKQIDSIGTRSFSVRFLER